MYILLSYCKLRSEGMTSHCSRGMTLQLQVIKTKPYICQAKLWQLVTHLEVIAPHDGR